MKIRKFLSQYGQTSVEYMLLMAVSVSMGLACFKKLNQYLLDNPDSYFKKHMGFYERLFDPQLQYKKFRLPR